MPLFPLNAVLFPGGTLSLRIFEPRYLDLVRECTRNDSGFGVCLILAGREAGEPATSAAVGTLARIEDFYSLPDGLLGIRARGSRRFRVASTRVRDNGLVHGLVRWWPDESEVPLPPEYSLLSVILERLLEQVGGEHARAERKWFNDATWVGFRLAELLPVATAERQQWLQLTDPLERLDGLLRCIPRFQAS
ncbi:MAG: LON peptidase substrate-binding domain-containing protein [Rhodanobacteraceae bacterium]|nr:LON peptidase substrate-binding domain-containing protein [Rhodanobacteraceae bacterium]